jgi:hypothetical protein
VLNIAGDREKNSISGGESRVTNALHVFVRRRDSPVGICLDTLRFPQALDALPPAFPAGREEARVLRIEILPGKQGKGNSS